MSTIKIKNNLLILVISLFFNACSPTIIKNPIESQFAPGNNNINIYAPDKSNSYTTNEVNNEINYYYETINLIETTINNYELYEQRLDDLFKEKKIKKKNYFENKDKLKDLKNQARVKRSEAQKALNEWKGLLRTSSYSNVQRDRFIADSIAFEDQKRIAGDQIRLDKERLEDEKKRIEIERKRLSEKEIEINNRLTPPIERPSADDELADNCYTLSVQSKIFGFRTRKLTQSELNACNECQSYVSSDGRNWYEDMSKSSCILKKKIDDETDMGSLPNGAFVQLLNTDGSFYRVRDISTGKIGYIASKYAGVSTLVKTSCK